MKTKKEKDSEKTHVPLDIKILSLAFLFIFFGFNGPQQFVVPFFDDKGIPGIGFNVLILIYFAFMISSGFSALYITRIGEKYCMMIASLFYSAYVFSLLFDSVLLVYITAFLVGIAAGFLWPSQNAYLIRASLSDSYGKNSGFFNTLNMAGAGLGILLIGFLISYISYKISFFIFAFLPLIGFVLLFKLKHYPSEEKGQNKFRMLKKAITSKTALSMSVIWLSFWLMSGLFFGIIPLAIKNTLNLESVGILSSIPYIAPVLLVYFFGNLSDKMGRTRLIKISYIITPIGLLCLSFFTNPVFLIMGHLMLALNYSIMRPVIFALTGDISTKDNLSYVSALVWIIQSLGIMSGLIIGKFIIQSNYLFLVVLVFIMLCGIFIWRLLKKPLQEIKEQINKEIIIQ